MPEPDERTALPWLSRSTPPDETETPAGRIRRRTAVGKGPVSPSAVTPGARSRAARLLVRRLPGQGKRVAPGAWTGPRAMAPHGPGGRCRAAAQDDHPATGRRGRGSRIRAAREAGADGRNATVRTSGAIPRIARAARGRASATRGRARVAVPVVRGMNARARDPTGPRPVRRIIPQEGRRMDGVTGCVDRRPAVGRRRGPLRTGRAARPGAARRRRSGRTKDGSVPGSRDPRPGRDSPPASGVRPSGGIPTAGRRIARSGAPVPGAGTATARRATDRTSPRRRAPTTRGIFAVRTDRIGSVLPRSTRT